MSFATHEHSNAAHQDNFVDAVLCAPSLAQRDGISVRNFHLRDKKRDHARPRRALATAPLRTGADTCKTGLGAGACERSGQNQTLSVGGATTNGRRTRQAGESVPT